jgi:hypothetical protein
MDVHAHSVECLACGYVENEDPEEPDDCDAGYDDADAAEAVHWGGMDA